MLTIISIIKNVSGLTLKDELWCGALDTLNIIMENSKVQELMDLLEEQFPKPVDITAINDFLWFDSEYIYEQLDIDELSIKF